MNRNFLNIPVSVCYLAIERNCIKQFQLFCWLKTQCSGHFKLTEKLLYSGINQLETTQQTLKKRLKWLVDNRWIGLNTKSGSYHINSFKVIHRRTGSKLLKGILWDYYDFRKFTDFIHAAILFHQAKCKWWYENKRLREQGRKPVKAGIVKGCSSKCIDRPSFLLPICYVAKKLNKTPSAINRMKIAAKRSGFILVKSSFIIIESDKRKFGFIRNNHPDGHKYIIRKGQLYEQLPDKIMFLITTRRKRNLKQ